MIPDEVPGSLSRQAITKLEGKLQEAGLVLLAGTSGGQAAETAKKNRKLLVKASPWAIDLVALGDKDRASPIEVFGRALYLVPPPQPSAGAVVLENSDQSGPSVRQVGGMIFVRPGTCAPGAASIPSIIRVDLSPNPPRCTCAIMQWDEGSGAWFEQPGASS